MNGMCSLVAGVNVVLSRLVTYPEPLTYDARLKVLAGRAQKLHAAYEQGLPLRQQRYDEPLKAHAPI